MKKRELKNMEWGILIVALILCIIGAIALFSATQESNQDEFVKQLIWIGISIVAMVIVMNINYEILVKFSPLIYGIFIALLVAVLFTTPINGATSWFNIGTFSFQPGEFAKVAVILFITFTISKIQEKAKEKINNPLRLLIVFAVMALPLFLIIKEPDYGTAAAYIVALILMLFTCRY